MGLESSIERFSRLDEFSKPPAELLRAILLSGEAPLPLQLRALYFCRDLDREECTRLLLEALDLHLDTFMRHEIAYVIGQSGCAGASGKLALLASDEREDPMVRHEAIEALAALKSLEFEDLIRAHSGDANRAVRHTCQLALHSLESSKRDFCSCSSSRYRAIDPIQTSSGPSEGEQALDSLAATLFDESLPLHQRYEALYAIRAISSDEAAKVIGEALERDRVSEVFRHECAFVLGQMQSLAPVDSLVHCLENEREEPMARHEAALALGSCGSLERAGAGREFILGVLRRFLGDPVKVVSDSCEVAIDCIMESRRRPGAELGVPA